MGQRVLSKTNRAVLREMFGGRCAYCGCELHLTRWHADHVEPCQRVNKWVNNPPGSTSTHRMVHTGEYANPGANRPDNFMPSCVPCNIDKSDMHLDSWRARLQDRVRVLRDNYSAFRHAERFGLVEVKDAPIIFFFERNPHA